MLCGKCGKEFKTRVEVDGVVRNLKNRKYCLECSPFGNHNTKKIDFPKKESSSEDGASVCAYCKKQLKKGQSKFCCQKCQKDYEYQKYIQEWKDGKQTGLRGKDQIASHVRRYMFEKYDGKCACCGWGEINPFTGKSPLEIHHVDGNYLNNKEENLVLLCPNCHSLTPNFKAKNKGMGRESRRKTCA